MRNDERLAQQHRQMVELDQFLIRLLRVQLHSIGCKPDAADRCVKENVSEISDLYRRWLEHTAFVLKEQPPIGAGDSGKLWKEWELRMQQWLADENMRAKALLADTMLRALPDILTGRRSATDIMFPNASMRMVEGVYKQNLIADHFNEVVAEQAVKHVQQIIDSGRRQGLRILEIGAGTGGTSEMLLSRFGPYSAYIQEYGYTDISKSFLSYAKTKYKDKYPYLAYHILNIEEPIADQNLAVGQYDLVVATNVLHATRNIRQTLRNAKALLKCKGVLLINEITENSLFNHVTFGLLKGWWLYEDEEVRLPGCPALSPEMWNVVLEQEGFESVAYPAADADFLGQQVIAAVSDGIVRQMRNAAPGGAAREADLAAIAAPRDQASQAEQPDLVKQTNQAAGEEGDSANRLSHKQLRQNGRAYFKKLIGEILEVEADSIDAGEALEMYGMDSILIIQLTDRLNKVMDEHVSSTLFFEYSTINALVDYFMQTRRQALIAMVGDEEAGAAPPQGAGDIEQRSDASMMKRPVAVTVRPAASASVSKDIAVIGLAGRYAQADHIDEFWENLKRGKHCITEIPEARWNWREHYHPEKGRKGSTYSKWGGFIRGIDTFDPLFFHISPKEAEQMDPQERQFLQIVYSSIEDAGYIPEALSRSRKVGVFVGIMHGNYPTGASYWSVANRVSYCLNFTGPSLAVDTACSSSLTAIHLALESLYSGTSDCAIAGGVNLIVDPVHYVRLSEKTMLSGGDQNRSFGDRADGFVDGEGVGAVVLKPLQLAEADGDHIYGVIKGSAINAGGKVKGYTVPNPGMQSQVVMEAIRRAGVEARAISYIEAHGTGTALGDPIEIEGLRRAFEHNTQNKQFCAIGSVKSNIGHCESAAGIAGLSKILLQLKHGQLAPSLHAEALNPNIRFGETPFYVQQELTEWKRPVIECDGGFREAPRIAGVSSFGAGGANAHVIVEEYIPDRAMLPAKAALPGKPHMIVLSAQNMDRLRARASQLLHAVAAGIYADGQLGNIAYTLQTGRVAMEARLAFIACSVEELEHQLNRFMAGHAEQEQLIFGEVQSRKEAVAEWAADEAMQEMVASWIRDKKYAQLLQIWVKGFEIDWDACYGSDSDRPSRISLPAYPFAEERYWVPVRQDKKDAAEGKAASSEDGYLHPLLHRNTSHLLEQRFSSVFNGREFFLSDHRVNNVSVLPGAAQLEMALAAVARAAPPDCANAGVTLTNVVWARPVTVEQEPVSVHIGLHLDQNREIDFEIYGVPEQGEEPVLYSQGRATLTGQPESRRIDISAVKPLCDKGMLTSEECYAAFAEMGLFYGERHRGIERLYLGRNQVLAKLTLPASVSDTLQAYTLHPVLIDSAFQASLGLTLDLMQRQLLPLRPPLPFALQRLEMPGGCAPAMWARVQYSVPRGAEDGVMKLDIDLCDESGNVCVHMQGFTTRLYSAEGGSYAQEQALAQMRDSAAEAAVSSSDPPAARALMLAPAWEAFHIEQRHQRQDLSVSTAKPLFIGGNDDLLETLRAAVPDASAAHIPENASVAQIKRKLEAFGGRIRHIVWVASTPAHAVKAGERHSPVRRQESELIQVFRLTKSLLQLGFGSRELDLTAITFQAEAVYPNDRANPGQAAVHGFMGSLAKEYPNWNIRVVDLEAAEGCTLQDILALPPDPLGNAYVHREEEWYRQELVPVEYAPLQHTVYRRGGVYVVIGGAGGIGEVWSEYMIRTYQARIVWIGRKNKDAVIQAKLDRLATAGPQPAYIQANATDLSELQRAYERIKGQYSRIDGIVHSALVLSDRSVANMEEEEFRAALAAKLDVSVNMAHVFRNEEPDFVLFFSSLNSFLKLPGQSNYVSGCTYADAFARQLSLEWPGPVKVMNWGYWGSVGSVASAQIRHSMEQKGIGSIEPAEANQALEQLLAGPLDQIVMMKIIKRPDLPALNESKTVTVFR